MGNGTLTGPLDQVKRPLKIDIGTMTRQPSPKKNVIGIKPDVIMGSTNSRYRLVPPGPGAFTEFKYKKWRSQHPRATIYHGGNWEPQSRLNRYKPTWFWSKGFFYAGSRYGGYRGARVEIWLRDKGQGAEMQIFRGPRIMSATQKRTKSPVPAQRSGKNPSRIDLKKDPLVVHGPEVANRQDAQIMGQRGYAILYKNGTIEFFIDGSNAPLTYKPRPKSTGTYDFYDEQGKKVENTIIFLEQKEIFSRQ